MFVGVALLVILSFCRGSRRGSSAASAARPSELEAEVPAARAVRRWARWPPGRTARPVLPAYLIGMVLAGTVGKDHALVRRLRTLTFGLLTPFYFIRAGSFVSVPALVAAPVGFCFLLVKLLTEDRGPLACDPGLPLPEAGSDVHDAPDVDGPDLRQHLGPVRPDPPDHRPGAVLVPGRRRDRQRRGPHLDCRAVYLRLAEPAVSRGRGCREGAHTPPCTGRSWSPTTVRRLAEALPTASDWPKRWRRTRPGLGRGAAALRELRGRDRRGQEGSEPSLRARLREARRTAEARRGQVRGTGRCRPRRAEHRRAHRT